MTARPLGLKHDHDHDHDLALNSESPPTLARPLGVGHDHDHDHRYFDVPLVIADLLLRPGVVTGDGVVQACGRRTTSVEPNVCGRDNQVVGLLVEAVAKALQVHPSPHLSLPCGWLGGCARRPGLLGRQVLVFVGQGFKGSRIKGSSSRDETRDRCHGNRGCN